ncbi:MAG TPA: lamin tail domain-containing protein, partial [Cyclobacteriaceae bacterium]|nr:lamin tail domain-containing protein [Cyclobacteriaceae bacterium]
MKRRILPIAYACFLSFLFFSQAAFAQANHVVISEVYGGGGNSGAFYKNDFIELYNPTNAAVDMTGWSVQYASATGNSWQRTNIPAATTIQPGRYFLIQQAAGTGGVPLPTADASGTIAMAAGAGKVVLLSNQTTLTVTTGCPLSGITGLIDYVGFGVTANCFEGSGPTPAPTNVVSVERKANASSTATTLESGGADEFLGNGYDSDNNATDFVARLTAPNPQNSSSSVEPDVAAPFFTVNYPKIGTISETQFDLVANMNETGKVYYEVLLDGATAPTAAQIKIDVGNAVALSGQLSITSASSDFTKSITGVQPSTAYDVYVVADDAASNLQSSPVKLDVTTNLSTSPLLVPSLTTITFPGFTAKTKQSAAQSYTMTAGNLTHDVDISVTGAFLISSDNINYGTSVTISM